ncbi:MAG: YdjY domain-containing protein [Verrucomicrobiales bacterium]
MQLVHTAGATLAMALVGPFWFASEPPAEASERIPRFRTLEGNRRALGGIEFDVVTREITLPATVNMTDGEIEYVLVHETGKVHESLLRTTASPFDLNVVLLLLDFKPDPGWFVPPAKPKPLTTVKPASLGDIFVRWKGAGGTEASARIEAWVGNLLTKRTAVEAPWVYSGSEVTADSRFAAEVDGTHIALYLDTRCVFNSPREGNHNDMIWTPAEGIQPKGTSVTLVLKPPGLTSSPKDKAAPSRKSGNELPPRNPRQRKLKKP